VSDFGKIKDKYKKDLIDNNIEWEEEGHTEDLISMQLVMKSPGIPDKASIVKKLVEKGIAVISEIEFAAPHKAVTIVTGSNGKTTTTMLTYHLLKSAGFIGWGNIGKSFALQVAMTIQ
jgi:UDP-N-acetylmuramoylalanine--D-glutamate ligase